MRRVRKKHLLSSFSKKKSKNIWKFKIKFVSLHCQLINKKNMSKFKKLVELAKNSAEKYIVEDVGYSGVVFLPTKTEDFIFVLGGDWYYQMLIRAGYAASTSERKVDNIDCDKLVSAIDDWYKTEMYPKLYNRFKSEGREILDF